MKSLLKIKNKDFRKEDWFRSLCDDCGAAMVEAEFNARWSLIEAYHKVGQRIREDSDKMPITELLKGIAVETNMSERKYWYAVQIYDKWPDLNRLPGGKMVSLNQVITKYLPDREPCKHEPETIEKIIKIIRCKKCLMRL